MSKWSVLPVCIAAWMCTVIPCPVFPCMLPATGADGQSAGQLDVPSASGRFLAEVRRSANATGDPKPGESFDLQVFELRAGGERRKQWSGLYEWRGGRDGHYLTDDGAAFVHVDPQQDGKLPLVLVILRGSVVGSFDARDLHLEPWAKGAGDTWIKLGPDTFRWGLSSTGLNTSYAFDLLGLDGIVRRLDIDRGTLTVHDEDRASFELSVQQAISEVQFPATQELYVDSWSAPALAVAGSTIEVEGHGHFPSAGWRFAGFQIRRDAEKQGRILITPRGIPGAGASAQVLTPHLWTARISGLAPGDYELVVVARGGSKSTPARALRVLSAHRLLSLEFASEMSGARSTTAVFDDGHIATWNSAGEVQRIALLPLETWQKITRAIAEMPSKPNPKPRSPAADVRAYDFTWLGEKSVLQARFDDTNLPAAIVELLPLLFGLPPGTATASSSHWTVDYAKSFLVVRTSSAGLLSALGHDHEIMVRKFSGEIVFDPSKASEAALVLDIDATSLAVVENESASDRDEIEKEMNDSVLESRKYPTIRFESTAFAARPAVKGVQDVMLTGDLALHGVTRSITIPGKLEVFADHLHVAGEIALKQTDYKIKPVSAAAGTIKVDDKVRFSFDLTAAR